MSVAARLIHRALWQHEVRTPDGAGGYVDEWVDVGYVQCRRSQPGRGGVGSTAEHIVADQSERRVTAVVHLAGDSGVQRGDRLVLDDEVLDVRLVERPSERAHSPIYRRAECSNVQEGRL